MQVLYQLSFVLLEYIKAKTDVSGSGFFKVRIRIDEKTRIHPDPQHWGDPMSSEGTLSRIYL